MKKSILSLSLMATACLVADQGSGDNCCPPSNCCTPCCVPQPKKCINNEAYNPQFYDLQCDWGFFATVDFLYWYSNESPFEIGVINEMFQTQTVAETGGNVFSAFPTKHIRFDGKWEPGFRVGLGWNMDCDGWDLYLNYTYYRADEKKSGSTAFDRIFPFPGESGIFNPWFSADLDANCSTLVETVSGKSHLNFNQIDLELGRKYWVSRCLALRPYMGLRAAWIHTKHDIKDSMIVSLPSSFQRFSDYDLKNRFWGVGFLGGLQPNFRLGNWCGCGEFSLYGNVEAALIWGKFKGSTSEDQFVSADFGFAFPHFDKNFEFPRNHDQFHRMQGILDLGIGIRWEDHWCCDRY